MTSKERVDNIMARKPVDRHPVIPLFMRYAAKLVNVPYSEYCKDYRKLVASDMKTYELFGYDMVSVISDAFREAHDLGADVEFPYDDVPHCKEYLLKEYSDLKKIQMVDILESERMIDRIKGVELFRKELGDSVPILGWVEGAFAEACDLRGVQTALLDTIDNPDFLFELLEKLVELEIRFAEEQIKAGAEWIGIGESVGSLVSSKTYQTFGIPYMKRLIDAVHRMGVRARLHICGDITHILPLIAELNVDIVDLDWMVSIRTARQKLGENVCIAGNFDPVEVLLKGTPDEIKRHIREGEEQAGDKYMVCPGCEVAPDTPYENIMAFCPGLNEK